MKRKITRLINHRRMIKTELKKTIVIVMTLSLTLSGTSFSNAQVSSLKTAESSQRHCNKIETAAKDDTVFEASATVDTIDDFGNIVLTAKGSTPGSGQEFLDAGYEYGDIVTVSFADKQLDLPVIKSFSDVDSGRPALQATDKIFSLMIYMGTFATTYGIATKTETETGGSAWVWNPAVPNPMTVRITMKEKAGYLDEYNKRHLDDYSTRREDFPQLSDDEFANFRVVSTSGMGKNRLYRGASPIDPKYNRNTYADAAIQKAGVTHVMNLADSREEAISHPGYYKTYYSHIQYKPLDMSVDFFTEEFIEKLIHGLRFFAGHKGVYYVHCLEGKDRCGAVIALLECLMGASFNEVVEDYMVSFYNYYGVVKGEPRYDYIAEIGIISTLKKWFGVEDLAKTDLAKASAEFVTKNGLTKSELNSLRVNLAKDNLLNNPMKASGKTVKVSHKKLKKKKHTIKRAKIISIKNAVGKLTYSKKSGSANIIVNKKSGDVTVAKKTKKGTYCFTVVVKDAGDDTHRAAKRKAKCKVRVA